MLRLRPKRPAWPRTGHPAADLYGSPMTTAFVIGRRREGRPTAEVVGQVTGILEAGGLNVQSAVVDRKSDVRRRAAAAVEDGCDIVVAVGGDGTVRRVVSAVSGTATALGIIPTGTGNLLAGNLGIPTRADRAAATILSGARRRVDAGVAIVDGKSYAFAVACGVGFDAEVMDATPSDAKRRWGKLAYFASALAVSGKIRNVPHEITVDGVTTRTMAAQVMVANFGRMMAVLSPKRPVLPDDGLFEVVIVRASGRFAALPAAWEALRQGHLGHSSGGRVFRAQAREVRIVTAQPRLVEIDGTVVGTTPIQARIVPAALTVLVPAP